MSEESDHQKEREEVDPLAVLLESSPLECVGEGEYAIEVWVHPESESAWCQVRDETTGRTVSTVDLAAIWEGISANNLNILCGGETENDTFVLTLTSHDIRGLKHFINTRRDLREYINRTLSRPDRKSHEIRRLETDPGPHPEGGPPRRPRSGEMPDLAASPFSFEKDNVGGTSSSTAGMG